MIVNRKWRVIIYLLVFSIVIRGAYFLYYLNIQSNFNILLITLDALRPDHLGCYGYKRNTSPNIDKLAREGVIFTQAISQAPSTPASLTSLLTSTYPSTHKVDVWGAVLDKSLFTLPEILKMKNYYTLTSSRDDFIYKDLPGFERGFNAFINGNTDSELIQQTVEWLKKSQSKKSFIWIHFFDYPHAPYLPPEPYNKIFISHETSRHVPIGGNSYIKGFIPNFVATNNITDVDYYISQYDGEVAYIDGQIGKILNELKKSNLNKNTLIIISSDHGESLGEHNYYFQHGYYLFDQLLKVPLIIRGPGIPKGKIINQQVQMIDIMPTILSLLKIKVDINMEGVSLLPIIFGKSNNSKLYAFSEADETEEMDLKSIRTIEWKLIRNIDTNKYELYNLKNDPKETINLVDMEKEKFEFLKAKLEEWMSRPKPNILSLKKTLDEQTKEKLKGLGYLQ